MAGDAEADRARRSAASARRELHRHRHSTRCRRRSSSRSRAASRTRSTASIMTKREKYKAHDENERVPRSGDKVLIVEIAPAVEGQALARRKSSRRRDAKRRRRYGDGDVMIQMTTCSDVADNSGAKKVICIKVLGGSKRKYASIGDVIVVSIREAMPERQGEEGRRRQGGHRPHQAGDRRARRQLHPVRRQLARSSSTRTSSRSAPASSGRSLASSAPRSS